MRPLKLEVQGFTAFRQFTTLDFADLELFALVGPTGSGKSSLLDAMTFALYGQTARLGGAGLDALISQGERGLSASLTFEVSGVTYRASRTKGRKQAENEVRFEHLDDQGRWTNLSEGSGGVKGISERIRRAVGLDFDTFRRSVMLPQGEFSRLLLGKPADRQALLGELTGLEHVQVMQRVASDRAKELKSESASLNAVLLSEYADVTAQALAELRGEREALSGEAERLTDERERLQTALTRLRDLEKIWRQREDTARRLNALHARALSVQDGAQRAVRARRVAGVLPLLDAAERARIAQDREARELARAQAQADAAAQAVRRAEGALSAAHTAEAQIPELEARAETLKDAEADAARLRRGGGTPQTTHPQPLPWDEDAFFAAREAAQKLEKVKQDRVKLTARRVGFTALKETQAAELARLTELEHAQARVQQEGRSARAAYQHAEDAQRAARTHAGIAAYRAHLHAGEPCPLCEQIVRDVPPGETVNMAALERAAETAKAELEGRLLLYKENTLQIDHLKKVTAERALTVADTEEQLTAEEEDNRAAEARIQGDPSTDALRLLASLAARVRAAGSDPAGQRREALERIRAVRQGVQDAQAQLARTQGDVAAANATLAAAQTNAAARQSEAMHAQAALDTALAALTLDAAQARAAALPENEIAALEEAARTYSAQVAQQQAALADLDRQLGAAPFDPAQLDQVSRDLIATDAALSATRERSGVLAEQERQMKGRLERKADIEVRAAAASRHYDTWQTLTTTLKTNEFQQFLLAEVEAQLLTRAGILLHEISDGRYRLALAGGDYVVQDLWNAGEVRGVKTLSGGETFLASLSLAIALSDYLAGNRVLGALFLDEGFGTLDPQALEAVAGALENLRTQGRMVGVVTHVESLSERLPSRLLVTKSIAGSSVHRIDG
ncbi:exonuclease SbcC [Deinococcus metalli]|uniref:Exonuclease SbcC n=1 Tax=Deinococcus metalli TaxID=1141878 RepID=A0A7W8KET4_9DEIO|nr:SMC family ATPase [Deinococcus metalli]MBB5376839.1 exonuclease SbcC [Deinococcus metalli]GHF45744.1 nuclease SbcCD subunit C [Deinococcus metalli]